MIDKQKREAGQERMMIKLKRWFQTMNINTLFQAPQNDHTTSSVDTLRLFNNDRRRTGFTIDNNFANTHKSPVNSSLISR